MEIRFIFDKKEAISELVELKSKYNFDDRNGLNYIIVGEHWSEIEDKHRLIYQIERLLNIDLSLLDYWNPKVFENELKIDDVQKVLENLKNKIEQNPNFYEKINYGFNLKENYFRSQFLSDVSFLIERMNLNKTNGAQKVSYETE